MTFRPREGVIENWVGRFSHRQVGSTEGNEIMLISDRRRAETPIRVFVNRLKLLDEDDELPFLGTRDLSEENSWVTEEEFDLG